MTRVLPAVDDRDLNVLIRGAQAAFANAQELFFEAAILGKAGHLSRALFLHQISMEECGKVDLLSGWIAGELLGFQQDTKKLERALASHEAKNIANAYMLELSEEEKLARQRKDWKGERNVFTRVKREFHEKSNRAKNAALYVDIKDGNVTTPQGSITTNMVAEIALQNERYLGLMQQSVRSMSKWARTRRAPRKHSTNCTNA
jgi:AbiV family abortive infection protein